MKKSRNHFINYEKNIAGTNENNKEKYCVLRRSYDDQIILILYHITCTSSPHTRS